MELKGFDQNYYMNELLDYFIAHDSSWSAETNTVADVAAWLQAQGTTAEDHYTNEGWNNALSPNKYFNAAEYKAAYQKVAGDDAAPITGDPYEHYLANSIKMDLNPSNAFDESQFLKDIITAYSIDMTVDQFRALLVDAADPASANYDELFVGLTAMTAYYLFQDTFDAAGIHPTATSLKGFDQNYYMNELLDYFIAHDSAWSAETNTVADVEAWLQSQETTAELHYMSEGWSNGLSPNKYFNPEQYETAYQKAAGSASPITGDPYEHYLANSIKMDLNPSDLFDESQFLQDIINAYTIDMTVDQFRALLVDAADPASANYNELFVGLTAMTAYSLFQDTFDAVAVHPTEVTSFSLTDYNGDIDNDASGLEIYIQAPGGILLDDARIQTDTDYNLNQGDYIAGGPGDDTIESGLGNDRINGAAGDDILNGGKGDDQLVGADGQDTFAYKFDSTENTLVGTDGSDIFFFETGDKIQFQDIAGDIDTLAELEAAETNGEFTLFNSGGIIFLKFADSGYTDQMASGEGQIMLVGVQNASSVNSIASLITTIGEESISFV